MTGGWGTSSGRSEPDVGETFVNGKDQETARGLLDACDNLGVTRLLVRTSARGFIVPNAVYDEYANDQAAARGI